MSEILIVISMDMSRSSKRETRRHIVIAPYYYHVHLNITLVRLHLLSLSMCDVNQCGLSSYNVEYILCRLAINKEVELSFLLTQAHRSGKERVRYVNIDDSLSLYATDIHLRRGLI